MYHYLKTLHVLAAILLMGSLVFSLMAGLAATRSGRNDLVAHVFAGVAGREYWLRLVAAVVLFMSGLVMTMLSELPIAQVPWLWMSLVIVAIVAVLQVFPVGADLRAIQRAALKQEVGQDAPGDVPLRGPRARVHAFTALSVVLMVLATGLMVTKPMF